MAERWYSTEELAELLGIDPSSLRRWRTAQPLQGPAVRRLSARKTIYSAADVDSGCAPAASTRRRRRRCLPSPRRRPSRSKSDIEERRGPRASATVPGSGGGTAKGSVDRSRRLRRRPPPSDWVDELSEAAAQGLNPARSSQTLAEYGDSVLDLALRGLEPKTTVPYLAGWRMRIVPTLGHIPTRCITTGAVDRAVTSLDRRRREPLNDQEHPGHARADHGTGAARRHRRPQPRPHQRLAARVPAHRGRTRRPAQPRPARLGRAADPRRRPRRPLRRPLRRLGRHRHVRRRDRRPHRRGLRLPRSRHRHQAVVLDRPPPDHHLAGRAGRQGHQGQTRPHRAAHPRGPPHGRNAGSPWPPTGPTAGCSSARAAAGSPPRSCATPPTGTRSSPRWASSGSAATTCGTPG